ncbi:MAG: YdcF family protein [bacterium]
MNTAEAVNILGEFCGPRDIPCLDRKELQGLCGIEKADVFVLFGGSVLAGGDVLAEAAEADIARYYIIVGGEGHTTRTLRRNMEAALPGLSAEGLPEAVLFDRYFRMRTGRSADFLECRSTNCGNNITYLLSLLEEEGIECASMILCQDASMQRRMTAGLAKYRSDITAVNYAAYRAVMEEKDGELFFKTEIKGMWAPMRYIGLLLGEIERLRDTKSGYGPEGKGFIAHVDIPDRVLAAFEHLKAAFPDLVRKADPRYGS